jgi:Sodium/hydrogen exchanger family
MNVPVTGATGVIGRQAIPRLRLAIGYAVMAVALAATLLGSFALGSRQEPAVNAAGVYRVDPPAPCLGGQVEVRQSGRFVDLAGERGADGSLELDGHRLTGEVRCTDGFTTPLQATVAGEADQRSLTGEVGGNRFRASFVRDHPEPAEAVAATGGQLAAEALFGRLMLAIAAVIVAARAVGFLAGRIGQPRVMGEVLAGILLGPTLLGALAPGVQAYLFPAQVVPLLTAVADLGLAFYMFLVGLELDPRLLRGRLAQAAFVSTASVAVPMLLGVALALAAVPLPRSQHRLRAVRAVHRGGPVHHRLPGAGPHPGRAPDAQTPSGCPGHGLGRVERRGRRPPDPRGNRAAAVRWDHRAPAANRQPARATKAANPPQL